jgi:hypothetical protein
MSDEETKYKHSLHRKRNIMAKSLRDHGDHKGAFALRVIDSRKNEYKRKRMKISDIYDEEE